jgi:hypothetical protein
MVTSAGWDLTSDKACWQTPPSIFADLHAGAAYDIDLTADANNRLLDVWFGPDSSVGEEDALVANWTDYGRRGYSNPVYGPFTARMLAKAKAEAHKGFSSDLLLPMRVTNAFRMNVLRGATQIMFCDKRICFWENGAPRLNVKAWRVYGQLRPDPALFDSIIVSFRPYTKPDKSPLIGEYHVPVHVTPDDLERARVLLEKKWQIEQETGKTIEKTA